MLFYVTMLHLARFLKEDPSVVDENDTDMERRVAFDQWGQGDLLYRNYILGALIDVLYNGYYWFVLPKSSGTLWCEVQN